MRKVFLLFFTLVFAFGEKSFAGNHFVLFPDTTKKSQVIPENYNDLIKKADDAFANYNWNTAIYYYQQAHQLKPGEKYPMDKIAYCEKVVADSTEMANAANNYRSNLNKGDSCFKTKNWEAAKKYYQQDDFEANADPYPKVMIKFCNDKLAEVPETSAKNHKEEYNYFIKQGDECYTSSDWENALRYYQLAHSVFPNEKYPKDQMGMCESKMGYPRTKQD
ncbi:MAG: hypothetical protein HY064_11150 [Bacteroidetes bacterium]|nr:hypothetical protein [Bacteroidota bacterium]